MPKAEDPECKRILASGKLVAAPQPSIVGPAGCGVADPVLMQAVAMPDGSRIGIEPPALMRCDVAERLAGWLREDVASADPLHGPLRSVAATGYACRGRNRIVDAPLSEHAFGNAVDILSFRFEHRTVFLKDPAAADVLSKVNRSACARFDTVLGPGSDGYHEDNLHLDLKTRKSGSHYCHWSSLRRTFA